MHPAAFDSAKKTLEQAASKVLATQGGLPASELSIEIKELRNQVNAFELSGPQSSRILWQVLSIIKKEDRKEVKQVGEGFKSANLG